ncbi:3-hydroxyisobutyrate dehydrogenase-related protein [Klebsormidium nitens]|uniref:3-hydroxyisobutyrate dehydrogenase-related protein n=1 Tax=Klebsormidium nitens TaxID=105231 RepID=A0A1Y1IPA0_KLENI|nr:3-hydroxyisobutyrate dehydrogenase-related protein [Klebsormidium nitens]|eukprot:GAQ92564.1 3-hydroxyisobutyrate dehydrogenase-related protein [Klebsormidium nitens]
MSTDAKGAAEGAEKKPSIGWLGLGIMGTAMTRNLLKAGYDVTVWNRTLSKAEGMVQEGARLGKTPAQVVRDCDITFAMLADPAAALSAALGEDGAVAGVSAGKGYVDVSTVDGDTARQIAEAVRKAGGQFLEAPVSGSKKPAEDGTLIFLTAGDKALFDRASAAFDVMGKAKFFLGDVGQGANMKLVVNMVMGSMLASFSEGLLLGQAAGLSPETILEVVLLGAINAPLYSMKGPTMLKGSYSPAFPLKHQQKDLRLALELAEAVGQPLPVAAAANALYEKAREAGLGDQDFSAVLEALKQRRGKDGA